MSLLTKFSPGLAPFFYPLPIVFFLVSVMPLTGVAEPTTTVIVIPKESCDLPTRPYGDLMLSNSQGEILGEQRVRFGRPMARRLGVQCFHGNMQLGRVQERRYKRLSSRLARLQARAEVVGDRPNLRRRINRVETRTERFLRRVLRINIRREQTVLSSEMLLPDVSNDQETAEAGEIPICIRADINGDGRVNAQDLAIVLSYWGTNYPAADLTNDGKVGPADMSIILACWGATPAPDDQIPPQILISPEGHTINEGDSVTLRVFVSGSAPLNYQWRFNGQDISNATTDKLEINSALPEDDGLYSVMVSNTYGSEISESARITVIPASSAPTVMLHPQDQTVTAGQMATFSVEAIGDALVYQWYKDGEILPGATQPEYLIKATMPIDGSVFKVLIRNSLGSVTSQDALLSVVAGPSGSPDQNGDGSVDLFDYYRVLDAIDTQDLSADLNGDGVVDSKDLQIVIEHMVGRDGCTDTEILSPDGSCTTILCEAPGSYGQGGPSQSASSQDYSQSSSYIFVDEDGTAIEINVIGSGNFEYSAETAEKTEYGRLIRAANITFTDLSTGIKRSIGLDTIRNAASDYRIGGAGPEIDLRPSAHTDQQGLGKYIVQFASEPVAKAIGHELSLGLRVSDGVIVNRKAAIEQEQANIISAVRSGGHTVNVHRRFDTVVNAAVVSADSRALRELSRNSNVLQVVPDSEVQTSLEESIPPTRANEVWEMPDSYGIPLAGNGVRVGVIDTGVDYTHPDLGGCFGTGCKVVHGYDFVNQSNIPLDDQGHGTHVAAIVAGAAGVAPEAKIYAYKVLDHLGRGFLSDVIAGIEASMDPYGEGNFSNRLDIINLSLGGNGHPDDLGSQAIDNATAAGVLAVVAAGNAGGYFTVGSPGVARTALTVGATDNLDQLANFSSRGPVFAAHEKLVKPDIVAPGVLICAALSSVHMPIFSQWTCNNSDQHMAISGTSMAAPHVAGVAALIKQAYPELNAEQLKLLITQSADRLPYDIAQMGTGRVNALRALEYGLVIKAENLDYSSGPNTMRIELKNLLGQPTGIRFNSATYLNYFPSYGETGEFTISNNHEYCITENTIVDIPVDMSVPTNGVYFANLDYTLFSDCNFSADSDHRTLPFLVSQATQITVAYEMNEDRNPTNVIARAFCYDPLPDRRPLNHAMLSARFLEVEPGQTGSVTMDFFTEPANYEECQVLLEESFRADQQGFNPMNRVFMTHDLSDYVFFSDSNAAPNNLYQEILEAMPEHEKLSAITYSTLSGSVVHSTGTCVDYIPTVLSNDGPGLGILAENFNISANHKNLTSNITPFTVYMGLGSVSRDFRDPKTVKKDLVIHNPTVLEQPDNLTVRLSTNLHGSISLGASTGGKMFAPFPHQQRIVSKNLDERHYAMWGSATLAFHGQANHMEGSIRNSGYWLPNYESERIDYLAGPFSFSLQENANNSFIGYIMDESSGHSFWIGRRTTSSSIPPVFGNISTRLPSGATYHGTGSNILICGNNIHNSNPQIPSCPNGTYRLGYDYTNEIIGGPQGEALVCRVNGQNNFCN